MINSFFAALEWWMELGLLIGNFLNAFLHLNEWKMLFTEEKSLRWHQNWTLKSRSPSAEPMKYLGWEGVILGVPSLAGVIFQKCIVPLKRQWRAWGGASLGKTQSVVSPRQNLRFTNKRKDLNWSSSPYIQQSTAQVSQSVSNSHSMDFWAGTAWLWLVLSCCCSAGGMLCWCCPLDRLFHLLSYLLYEITFLEINSSSRQSLN